MGGEPGHIEQAHRQQNKSDRNRKNARREAKALEWQRRPQRACAPGQRFRERRCFSAALVRAGRSNIVELRPQPLSSSSIWALIMAEKLASA